MISQIHGLFLHGFPLSKQDVDNMIVTFESESPWHLQFIARATHKSTRAAIKNSESCSDHSDVDRIQAFLAFLDLELNRIILADGSLYVRFMHEYFFIGSVDLNKAESSHGIKKFYCSSFHFVMILMFTLNLKFIFMNLRKRDVS